MNVVFLGTPESAVPSLGALLAAGHVVPLVVTQPDRPAGRSGAPRPPAVKVAAARAGIRVVQPEKVRRPEFLETIAAAAPDVLAVVAFGRILPQGVLDVAPRGAVNVHFSLLPRYRGAAPVQWSLARGDRVTGVTTMKMNAALDEGDVLLAAEVPVEPGEHAPSLTSRLATIGAALLVETLARMEEGALVAVPQDPALATFAPVLSPSDGDLRASLGAREIEGRVRGFDPWPGAWVRREGKRIRLLDASVREGRTTAEPAGTVLGLEDGALLLACGGGSVLAVASLQVEGRRPVSARDAANGRVLRPGDVVD